MSAKKTIKRLLDLADIKIDGTRPWDIQVHNPKLYKRVLSGGSLALGEAYMDGWWDCKALDQFFFKILRLKIDKEVIGIKSFIIPYLKTKLFNLQKLKSHHIGEWHYDIGNELYTKMLDKNMQYSCGYWKKAKNLDEAQEDKIDLICKKLQLKKGETLLDIGCGWGGLMRHAAKKYGVKCVGVTVSKEQAKYAKEICKGLPVDVRIQDYRELNEKFDKIVSVGMVEHVGYKNYKEYLQVASGCLKDEGLFLLHTIGANKTTKAPTDPWIDKYIFPNGKVPSIRQLMKPSEKLFVLEDIHSFGAYYDNTLMAWKENFEKAWPKIKKNYDERFYRMWKYYLLMCAGSFRARKNQLWQIVFSKKGVLGVYDSIR